jgi:cytochrome c peroxidase
MFWTWRVGYTFLRLDLDADGPTKRLFFHLGSTGCVRDDGDQDAKLPPDRCARGNRPQVVLADFDPLRDTVLVDLAELLGQSRLDTNQVNTAKGCMAAEDDQDCAPLFAALGLAFGDQPAGAQRVFRSSGAAAAAAQGAYHLPTGEFRWDLPAGFPEPRVPRDNPMSVAKVELGRHLFYDRRLSADETANCATCHQQGFAFTDPRPHPVGITGQLHPRSSMSLANVAYSPVLTWSNLRIQRLEQQALVPMFGEDPVEMGLAGREAELIGRVQREPRYRLLFPAAFPGEKDPYTLANITRALSAFERTLLSGRSAYDRALAGDRTAMTPAARRGEQLFLSERLECFHCHGGFNFTGTIDYAGKASPEIEFHNTGLYNIDGKGGYPAPNIGLMEHTGDSADMGSFKAPTLRNVAVTAPYMHDGSIATLDEVVEHYMAGGRTIAEGPNAGVGNASPLKSAFVPGFSLTAEGRGDLVAFLASLTDSTFLSDPRFADPWPAAPAGRRGS